MRFNVRIILSEFSDMFNWRLLVIYHPPVIDIVPRSITLLQRSVSPPPITHAGRQINVYQRCYRYRTRFRITAAQKECQQKATKSDKNPRPGESFFALEEASSAAVRAAAVPANRAREDSAEAIRKTHANQKRKNQAAREERASETLDSWMWTNVADAEIAAFESPPSRPRSLVTVERRQPTSSPAEPHLMYLIVF